MIDPKWSDEISIPGELPTVISWFVHRLSLFQDGYMPLIAGDPDVVVLAFLDSCSIRAGVARRHRTFARARRAAGEQGDPDRERKHPSLRQERERSVRSRRAG